MGGNKVHTNAEVVGIEKGDTHLKEVRGRIYSLGSNHGARGRLTQL